MHTDIDRCITDTQLSSMLARKVLSSLQFSSFVTALRLYCFHIICPSTGPTALQKWEGREHPL
jgi:hypothetical protein